MSKEYFLALLDGMIGKLIATAIVIVVAICMSFIVRRILKAIFKKARNGELDPSVSRLVVGICITIIYVVSFIIILDFYGVNTSGILAMVGACGLAIGLALKDTLSNIAAGLMIIILHPFKAGDYIDCGSVSGTVNIVGLFTTKLTTADGIFVEAPNSVLWGNVTKNYSRNSLRRIDIAVGVSFGDSVVEAIRVLMSVAERDHRTLVSEKKPIAFVDKIDKSSVNLVLRVWVHKDTYWDALHDLSRDVKLGFDEANITIPFPQCDVHIKNNP